MSILDKSQIDVWLRVAKHSLKADGYLAPVLFVVFSNPQLTMIPIGELMRTEDHHHRRVGMFMLGEHLREKHGEIKEVIMIIEGWYVNARESEALEIPPSQHPARQEAICIVGRNASNSRTTSLIQPFIRDANHQLVWRKIEMAVYNQSTAGGPTPAGLLDCLFTPPANTH